MTKNYVILILKKSPGGIFDKNISERRTIMLILLFVIGIVIGVIAGSIAGCVITRNAMLKKTSESFVGTLRVDTSDPDDQPYMFLELSKNVGDITSKKSVLLKVSTENYISQN